MTNQLFLFDIDQTLLSSSGAGMRAMVDAGRDLFGPSFNAEGVDYAGRLDPLIVDDMLRVSQIEPTADARTRLRARYHQFLEARLRSSEQTRALPGVIGLLDLLEKAEVGVLGLLTGNFRETGELKLAACGINPSRFSVSAWGDDSPHSPPQREHLTPIAMDRCRERHGFRVPASRVTIIGDTPHDVRCAKAHGCRALGVGTGRFTPAQLLDCGADHAIDSLEDARGVFSWLAAP